MRSQICNNRSRRCHNERRINRVALRIEDLCTGKTVGVAALECYLNGNGTISVQRHARCREIDLVRVARLRYSKKDRSQHDHAPKAHDPAPTALRSSVKRLTSNSATVTTPPSGARRA
jgi:hypothetical protein